MFWLVGVIIEHEKEAVSVCTKAMKILLVWNISLSVILLPLVLVSVGGLPSFWFSQPYVEEISTATNTIQNTRRGLYQSLASRHLRNLRGSICQ